MKKETQALFKIFEILEEIRDLWRETAPKHEFDKTQKIVVEKYIKKIEKQLEVIKEVVYGT